MNCKNHKIRTKKGVKYGYCTLYKKEVPIFGCKCENFEYKAKKSGFNQNRPVKPIKNRSNKLAKAEKGRYSIIYQDLSKCAVCGVLATELNEVYEGTYRQASINYGMVMPMCHKCHERFHAHRTFAMYYKIMFEKEFLKSHTIDEWLDIFKIDYRYKK